MAAYRLHCFAQSGNAYKVALMLNLAGADWEPVFVDYFGGKTRTPAFRRLNPMGEVPVLEAEGQVLTQSGAILDWLADRFGRFRASDRTDALRWLLWDNHKLTAHLSTWRFLTNFAPEAARRPDVLAFLEGRARGALRVLDDHLAGQTWMQTDGPTFVDLSVAGYLFYRNEVPIDWAHDYPAVLAWAGRLAALPGWAHPYDLMPGHPMPEGEQR